MTRSNDVFLPSGSSRAQKLAVSRYACSFYVGTVNEYLRLARVGVNYLGVDFAFPSLSLADRLNVLLACRPLSSPGAQLLTREEGPSKIGATRNGNTLDTSHNSCPVNAVKPPAVVKSPNGEMFGGCIRREAKRARTTAVPISLRDPSTNLITFLPTFSADCCDRVVERDGQKGGKTKPDTVRIKRCQHMAISCLPGGGDLR